jgi:PhzF family phenazine biosynthesis protein
METDSTKATLLHVDAFTETPFKGNPAGVCLLQSAVADQWMQQVANEMNLSEVRFAFYSCINVILITNLLDCIPFP